MFPRGGSEKVYIDDKVLLEYYKLEKDFDGGIKLEPSSEGFTPITGEAGRREKQKGPLTIIIDKINEKYGTSFTEMDKVLLQIENDYMPFRINGKAMLRITISKHLCSCLQRIFPKWLRHVISRTKISL